MAIPSYLISRIREGNAVIVLGAGASFNAKDQNGNSPPSGKRLGEMLSDKFLGGKYKDRQLSQISEYAISESDLISVQDYIKDTFIDFCPTKAHNLLTKFRWHGIATTNYDLLIEKAYQNNKKQALQVPKTFIENTDKVEEKLKSTNAVALLKLHGCITRISNPKCPLILSTDQFINYKFGRDRIFDHLQNWSYEFPIIYIGHSLQDFDLRIIIKKLEYLEEAKPRNYIITPITEEIEIRYWETKKISVLKYSFIDFMQEIDSKIPSQFRILANIKENKHPITNHYRVKNDSISDNCIQFLNIDADYVKIVNAKEKINPKEFYKGYNSDWAAIDQNLDVRRNIIEKILSNYLVSDKKFIEKFEFILIKGHAGSGKTILLRRIAWEAAKIFDCLCIYLNDEGQINSEVIQEIINNTKERLFLFIDDVPDRYYQISHLIKTIGDENKLLTIIGATRINEWNTNCSTLEDLITEEFKIRYLSEKEIAELLSLLTRHKALGTLEALSYNEQKEALKERAGRQLLVALHEATLGKQFEEIIADEFKSIKPIEAQLLYLTICTLNRFNVPVRAGIISRIYYIPFTEFKKRFFKPLEEIVKTSKNDITGNYEYKARHHHIAEIIFDKILINQEEKFNTYIQCLNSLNIDYSSDEKAFIRMINAKELLTIFANIDYIELIYKDAKKIASENANVYHQMALYEMKRKYGNIQLAINYLEKASSLKKKDRRIRHTYSELLLKQADRVNNDIEKDAYYKKAESIALTLISQNKSEAYSYHTLCKISLERIRLYLKKKDFLDQVLQKFISSAEEILLDGLQQFPDNSYLLSADSDLGTLIKDSERTFTSLKKAFEVNNRNSLVALRLARILINDNEIEEAKTILVKALNAQPYNKRLNFTYAKLLIDINESDSDTILYYLKRSFDFNDKNYIAKILYGKELFLKKQYEECTLFFTELREKKGIFVSYSLKNNLNFKIDETFTGEIVNKDSLYCFIARDGIRDHIYCHPKNVNNKIWIKLMVGLRVSFQIAFTMNGMIAFNLKILA